MTEPLLLNDYMADLVVLSNVKLEQDSHDTPDNLYAYIEAPLTTLVGLGNLAYARFNPNSFYRRRNPATNKELYNIDLPTWGTTPSLAYKMIGSRTHIDATLADTAIVYPEGTHRKEWGGMVWRSTEISYILEGLRIQYDLYMDAITLIPDRKFYTEVIF